MLPRDQRKGPRFGMKTLRNEALLSPFIRLDEPFFLQGGLFSSQDSEKGRWWFIVH
jgi:hypothetical protein